MIYNPFSIGIAVNNSVGEMMQLFSEFGQIHIAKTGNCANFDLNLEWKNEGGEQPLVEVLNYALRNSMQYYFYTFISL